MVECGSLLIDYEKQELPSDGGYGTSVSNPCFPAPGWLSKIRISLQLLETKLGILIHSGLSRIVLAMIALAVWSRFSAS